MNLNSKKNLRLRIAKVEQENREWRSAAFNQLEVNDTVIVRPDGKFCWVYPSNIDTFGGEVGIVVEFSASNCFGDLRGRGFVHVKFPNGGIRKLPIYNRDIDAELGR